MLPSLDQRLSAPCMLMSGGGHECRACCPVYAETKWKIKQWSAEQPTGRGISQRYQYVPSRSEQHVHDKRGLVHSILSRNSTHSHPPLNEAEHVEPKKRWPATLMALWRHEIARAARATARRVRARHDRAHAERRAFTVSRPAHSGPRLRQQPPDHHSNAYGDAPAGKQLEPPSFQPADKPPQRQPAGGKRDHSSQHQPPKRCRDRRSSRYGIELQHPAPAIAGMASKKEEWH